MTTKPFDAEAVFTKLMEQSQRAEFFGGPLDGRVQDISEGVTAQVFWIGEPRDGYNGELYKWGGEERPDGTRMFRYRGPR